MILLVGGLTPVNPMRRATGEMESAGVILLCSSVQLSNSTCCMPVLCLIKVTCLVRWFPVHHIAQGESMKQPLTGWHTVTEISQALAVPSSIVRRFFMRAYRHGEPFVQIAENPRRLLIDTQSEGYQQFVQHYCHLEEAHMPPTAATLPVGGFSVSQSLVLNWSALRQWLMEEGVLIFCNVLAEKPHWQWQWGTVTGEGYASIEDAVLAALRARMAQAGADHQQQEEVHPILPARLLWFGPRCHRREPPYHWL